MRDNANQATHDTPPRQSEEDLSSTRRRSAALVLLTLLERADHGYGLAVQLQPLVTLGRVYRSLQWLEQRGFIEGTWDTSGAGPARRIFRVTASGRSALESAAPALRRRAKAIGDEESRLVLRQLRKVMSTRETFRFTVAAQLLVEASDEQSARHKLQRIFGRAHMLNDVRPVGGVSILAPSSAALPVDDARPDEHQAGNGRATERAERPVRTSQRRRS